MPTQKQIGEALGVTKGRVTQLKQAGMPVDSIARAMEWYAANVTPPSTSRGIGGGLGMDYQEARAERETAEARIAQIRLAELEGAVIRVDAVRAGLAGLLASTRDRLMQLPARLAPVLAAESSQERVHDIVADEIHHVLTQLATAPKHVGLEGGE